MQLKKKAKLPAVFGSVLSTNLHIMRGPVFGARFPDQRDSVYAIGIGPLRIEL